MTNLRARLAVLTADLPPTYWYLWTGILINRLGSFVIPFLTLYLTSQRGDAVDGLPGSGGIFVVERPRPQTHVAYESLIRRIADS